MNWLALDIGGANIKAADGRGFAHSYPFALWRDPSLLAHQVRTAISEAPPCDHLAITMTGELADCFESKAAGVRHILEAVQSAAGNRHTRVYLVDGRLVAPQVALTLPRLAAASNWHALARFAARYAATAAALLIDVGSTTCDVIPLIDAKPAAKGQTDTQRLLSGELVYTGVERSPLCAVLRHTPYRGQSCPVVQELFATMRDAYQILDLFPDDPAETSTADGKPATTPYARSRLARMIAADDEEFNHRDAVIFAQAAAEAQTTLLAAAIRKVVESLPESPQKLVLSGHGEFLARRALESLHLTLPTISLAKELGSIASRCAPAHALAVLASEQTVRIHEASMLRVIKVGGSHLDWPNLPAALRRWLAEQSLATNVLICGGGKLADCIRDADQRFALGDERAHWLAVDCMSITSRLLAHACQFDHIIDRYDDLLALRAAETPLTVVFDVRNFLREFEPTLPGTRLPHDWTATSDSVAARLASALRAHELVLLKSSAAPNESLDKLASLGYVDPHFPRAVPAITPPRLVNLRAEPKPPASA